MSEKILRGYKDGMQWKIRCACLRKKNTGKPYAGKSHVRFVEGELHKRSFAVILADSDSSRKAVTEVTYSLL